MTLREFLKDRSRRTLLANRVGTHPEYLRQLSTGWRRPSRKLAIAIERETARIGPEAVTKESLIFGDAPETAPVSAKGGSK